MSTLAASEVSSDWLNESSARIVWLNASLMSSNTEITVIAQAPIQKLQGTQALIWTDIPANRLRREIREHL